MPTPVYKAQITLHSYFPLPTNLANPPTSGLDEPVWDVGLAASDGANSWYISMELLYDFGPPQWTVRTTYYHTLGSTPDSFPTGIATADNIAPFPFAGVQDYDVNPAPGAFVFPQDWLISITKDYDNDRIRFAFPWAPNTHDYALSNPLFVKDASALRPSAIFSLDHGGNQSASPTGFTAEFQNIVGSMDGVPFVAAAMSAADPGMWDATLQYLPVSSPAIDNLDGQLAATYRMGYTETPPNPPPYATERQRNFEGGLPMAEECLDAVKTRFGGELAIAGVLTTDPNQLEYWYSDDDGHTLNPVAVDGSPSQNLCFPSLVPWPDGRLLLFYQKNGQIGQIAYAISINNGRTWAAGPYLVVADSPIEAPRLRLDPASGVLYLVYYRPELGELRLLRYDDLLNGGSPSGSGVETVATGVSTFEQPDLWWDGTGGLYIQFSPSTLPTVRMSRDFGRSWATVASFAADTHRRARTIPASGVHSGVYSDGSAAPFNLQYVLSEDAGVTARLSSAVGTVADKQYNPIAAGDRGQLWVVRVVGAAPAVKISDDYGKNWRDA